MMNDGPCYYCGEPTNSLAGNPGMWSLHFTHSDEPGKVKPHHVSCVQARLEPWKQGILKEWDIVGMNHYFVDGKKRLFVAMVKDGVCIKEEGADNALLWERLWHKASP